MEFLASSLTERTTTKTLPQKNHLLEIQNHLQNIQKLLQESAPNEEQQEEEEAQKTTNEANWLSQLAATTESMVGAYINNVKKEKKQLEMSIVSLTEENRDIGKLLRSALAEKEAALKAFKNREGRGSLFQIVHKIGFTGFGTDNQQHETPVLDKEGSYIDTHHEPPSLATSMENIIKSMRHEMAEMKESLESSREEANQLKALSDDQANKLYRAKLQIQEFEEREIKLLQNVDSLTKDLTMAEEDVLRWRQACELEAEAGTNVMKEYKQEIARKEEAILDLQKSLELANRRLKIKEELTAAAMAAREAAERSLNLADKRISVMREKMNEMSRQMESEPEDKHRNRARYACWPWRWLRATPSLSFLVPEMHHPHSM